MQFLKLINDWHSMFFKPIKGSFQGCSACSGKPQIIHPCLLLSTNVLKQNHTNTGWWKAFNRICFHTWMKSKRDILLVLSPASSQSLASVFLFFTAQIKANRWMYHQHGTKNRIQRTATMEDTKRVWASCFLLEFCPSPCSYVSKVGGVKFGGW